jgi:hypothetical protein
MERENEQWVPLYMVWFSSHATNDATSECSFLLWAPTRSLPSSLVVVVVVVERGSPVIPVLNLHHCVVSGVTIRDKRTKSQTLLRRCLLVITRRCSACHERVLWFWLSGVAGHFGGYHAAGRWTTAAIICMKNAVLTLFEKWRIHVWRTTL